MGNKLHLLPLADLMKTGGVDHADWNYRPLIGSIERQRFYLVRSLLGSEKYDRLLELGYGSGVLMPQLIRSCRELYGIDVHGESEKVAEILARNRVEAKLFSQSAEALPFEDKFFDCIVAVSVLEFIGDLETSCRQMVRVLKPDGCLVTVTPGHSLIVDLGLKILTGESAKKDYGNHRDSVIQTLDRHFKIIERVVVPRLGHSLIHLYTGMKHTPKGI